MTAEPDPEYEVFLTGQAFAINAARQNHLASLGLELSGKRVLEVGAGIGLHTEFFEARGCRVVSTDGNPSNIAEITRRHPERTVRVLDLDDPSGLDELGEFDVVYCYGTLYHLSQPERALRALAGVCRGMILLETCIALGRYPELHLVRDTDSNNQSIRSIGCRPTRSWVMEKLQTYFGHAYITVTQPDHRDFDLDWRIVESLKLHRAVFVGSKQPLANALLVEEVPEVQTRAVERAEHPESLTTN
jgi:SAM-dependent methyltransferase